MDYLFYGNVGVTKEISTTIISLNIFCEPGETIQLYEISSDASRHLVYK